MLLKSLFCVSFALFTGAFAAEAEVKKVLPLQAQESVQEELVEEDDLIVLEDESEYEDSSEEAQESL